VVEVEAGMNGGIRLDRIVLRVFEMLREVRLGTVVAVWWDGGVSAHRDLAFRYRVLPSGQREEPIATFVADGGMVSVAEIRERILRSPGVTLTD
jgi:hypothetical protein